MKVKTSKLIGPALDWAVAKCEGCQWAEITNNPLHFKWIQKLIPHYTTDWSQGGPIIEQLRAYGKHRFIIESDGDNVSILAWSSPYAFCNGYGPTTLIAAMRCYVASKLGDEVDIPEELNG